MFLAFLFKWAIALTLLYSLYGLLLRRETFYRVNRIVLLAMLPLSAWLATLRIETQHTNVANRTMAEVTEWMAAPTAAPAMTVADAAPIMPIATAHLLLIIYYIGLAFFALQYLFALIQVVRIIRNSRPTPSPSLRGRGEVTTSSTTLSEAEVSIIPPPSEGTGEVLLNDSVDSPFSWFRWIVISSKDLADNGRVFLAHERSHVRHGHSWDMLLCEFCVRLQWFNPFAWQLREDLRAVHEFQADQSVIQAGCDVREYNMLLIDKALGGQLAPVANALTQGELKNRIRMMHRKPSPWMAMLKVLYVVPFALVTLAIFAKPIAVQNIVNARSASSILGNLKYVVSLSPEDAVPEINADEEFVSKEEVAETKAEKQQKAAEPLEAAESQSTSAAESPSSRNSSLHAPSATATSEQQARIAEIQATSAYQRQRAEKAIAQYVAMSVNPRKTSTYVLTEAYITLDHDGRVTDVSFPEVMNKYTWFDADEAKARISTLPRDLARDYVGNLDKPSDANVVAVEFHYYKQ